MLVRWHQSKKERKGKTIQLYIMWKTLWRPCWLRYCLNSVWGSRTMKRFPITCPTGLVRTRVLRLLAGRQPNNIEVPSFLSLWRLAEGESNKRKLTRKRGGFLFSPPFYSIRQKQNIFLSFVERKKKIVLEWIRRERNDVPRSNCETSTRPMLWWVPKTFPTVTTRDASGISRDYTHFFM